MHLLGELVDLCGFILGSGKTSILNILFRLYDITKGGIFVDGKEISEMSKIVLY